MLPVKFLGLLLLNITLLVGVSSGQVRPSQSNMTKVAYTGCYSDTSDSTSWVGGTRGKGIEAFRVDSTTGVFSSFQTIPSEICGINPSFLTTSYNNKFLFSVNEESIVGGVHSFVIDGTTGSLSHANKVTIDGLNIPVHIAVSKNDKYIHVAYYNGGYGVFPILSNGMLGSAAYSERFLNSQVHMAFVDHTDSYVYLPDKKTNVVWMYSQDTTKYPGNPVTKLPAFVAPEGCGARHIVVHKNDKWAYLICEFTSEVLFLSKDVTKSPMLTLVSKYQMDINDKDHQQGGTLRFNDQETMLFTTNRVTDNSVVSYKINPLDGTLVEANRKQTGRIPRELCFFDNQLFVASVDSNIVQAIIVDNEMQNGFVSDPTPVISMDLPLTTGHAGNPSAIKIIEL